MRLVCGTEEWHRKYEDLCYQRRLGFKPWPSRMALFAAEGRDLVAGAMVYDSTGPFIFFEHLVTNETAPARVRWAAVYLLAQEMMHMCRMMGKVPQVTVQHKGIAKILRRVGLVAPGALVMTCGFDALESRDDRETQTYASTREPGCGRESSTATEPSPPGDSKDYLGVYAEVLGGRGTQPGRGVE
jgi:hypothetical protein